VVVVGEGRDQVVMVGLRRKKRGEMRDLVWQILGKTYKEQKEPTEKNQINSTKKIIK